MKQHQVILSIGSNQGNRLYHIENGINLIHKKVATVVKTSKLYETPSWGFQGEAFYNCAILVHTYKKAEEILRELLEIERESGRIRLESEGYQSRTLDIDIIAFDDQIIETQILQIPHPRMQERLFVLQPLKDIFPDYTHPKTKKTIRQLVQDCQDSGEFKVVSELKNPLENYRFTQFNHLVIEGNIGAGKTTLATKISEDFNAKLLLEGFADNPFLPMFYEDQTRYAFPLEMSFLADRYQQLSDDLTQLDLFKSFTVTDYYIFKSLIFSRVTLEEEEYRLYQKIFDIMYKEIPKPDLYIYMYQETEQLLQNIRKRGRSYEQEIPSDYLEKINQGYLDYLRQQKDLNVLILDVSDKDFVAHQEDYLWILEWIANAIN
ncbi:MAG: 2-amino-4-hydroxy-6-hydroxymethyldihydropteridine diphosphokinase [Flavobacteriaceae bacterium]